MATRNLTSNFHRIRAINQTKKVGDGCGSGSRGSSSGSGSNKDRDSVTINPIEYIDFFNRIDENLILIKDNLKLAESTYNNLIINIFSPEKLNDELIFKINELTKYCNIVRTLFSEKNKIFKKFTKSHDIQIIKNMYSQKIDKFRDYINLFQKLKQKYIDHVNKSSKPDKLLFQINEDIHGYDDVKDTSTTSFDHSITYVDTNEMIIAERNEEIIKISRSIVELNETFRDLSELIHDQGHKVDKIDDVMAETVEITKKGISELEDAHKSQKKSCSIQ
jgi:hypothetical protein